MSSVKMNISRINSEGRIVGFISTGYWVEYQREKNLSSVKMNISRINSLGNEIRIIITFY